MHPKISGLQSLNIRRNSQTEEDMDQPGLFSATSRNFSQGCKRMRNSRVLGGSPAKKAKTMSYSEDSQTNINLARLHSNQYNDMGKAVEFGDTKSKMLVDFLNGLDELKISKNIKMRQQFSIIIKTLNIFIGDKAVEDFINSEPLEKVCNWNGVVISILQSKCAEFLSQNLRLLNELGSFLDKSIFIGMSHPSTVAGVLGESKSRLLHVSTLLNYYDCHLDFSNTNLQNVKLRGPSTIDLTNVNLMGANLTGAKLHGVRLSIDQWYQLRLQKITLTKFVISYESCINKLYQVYKLLIHAKIQGKSPFDFLPDELKIFQLILLQKSIIQVVQDNKGTVERKSEFEGWMQLYG